MKRSEDESLPTKQPKTGVHCYGCERLMGKGNVTYATDNNRAGQPFCTACNNQLRRYFGVDYGQTLADPRASLKALRDRLQQKKDVKVLKKRFRALVDIAEDCDLDHAGISGMLSAFAPQFDELPEARPYLSHFTQAADDVKDAARMPTGRERVTSGQRRRAATSGAEVVPITDTK